MQAERIIEEKTVRGGWNEPFCMGSQKKEGSLESGVRSPDCLGQTEGTVVSSQRFSLFPAFARCPY
jgi:hypothetical protein